MNSVNRIRDDRDRELVFLRPPRRIVSLVPSDTYNLEVLGRSVVGRTRYCDTQSGELIGGTKDVDVAAVARLEPDLILANQEENSQKHLMALARLGLPLLVSFPRTVIEGLSHLVKLAKILEADARDLLRRGYAAAHEADEPRRRVFVPIWMDPLMTVNAHTFISDALRLAGGENVFADRDRRFPLAADLGQAVPKPSGTRDTRYPRVTLEEVIARKPEIILLPDEPHPFSPQDARVFEAVPGARVIFCSGRDLCWYGARSIEGIPRLRAVLR